MDPMRFDRSVLTPGVPTPPMPATMPASAAPAAPQDQVQIQGHPKSCLLDKAKNIALGSSVGISAAGLLEAAGVAGAGVAIGGIAGIAALIATGMAAIHFGKKMWAKHQGGGHPQPPAPPVPPAPQQGYIAPGPGVPRHGAGSPVAPGVPAPAARPPVAPGVPPPPAFWAR